MRWRRPTFLPLLEHSHEREVRASGQVSSHSLLGCSALKEPFDLSVSVFILPGWLLTQPHRLSPEEAAFWGCQVQAASREIISAISLVSMTENGILAILCRARLYPIWHPSFSRRSPVVGRERPLRWPSLLC